MLKFLTIITNSHYSNHWVCFDLNPQSNIVAMFQYKKKLCLVKENFFNLSFCHCIIFARPHIHHHHHCSHNSIYHLTYVVLASVYLQRCVHSDRIMNDPIPVVECLALYSNRCFRTLGLCNAMFICSFVHFSLLTCKCFGNSCNKYTVQLT